VFEDANINKAVEGKRGQIRRDLDLC
jgi:hypothetical protein